MAGNTVVSRRMGEMNEGRLILKLAVPMMLSMLVQAMYNIVDSIYVSMVSEDCLSALSLAFPAQNIMIGLATGTGVGVSTLISRALGRGDRDEAGKTAGTAIFLCFCCWVLMALFGIFGADAFIRSQTKVESIRSYADSYLRIVTTASLFLYLQVCAERFLQSTGLTKYSMWTQIIGAVTNIILDPSSSAGAGCRRWARPARPSPPSSGRRWGLSSAFSSMCGGIPRCLFPCRPSALWAASSGASIRSGSRLS